MQARRGKELLRIGFGFRADLGDDFLGIGLRAKFCGGSHGLMLATLLPSFNSCDPKSNTAISHDSNDDVHVNSSELFARCYDLMRRVGIARGICCKNVVT